jgi:D-alanyl-lipoteichoic acid acyltransferase DltB (MBOAT superfamily)
VVDPVFAAPNEAGKLELFQAMYGYAIQIYADFSGYTDIAIGVALLLGFRFPVNFDNPYRSLSIQDFWRRWHITLSSWLRDYLYIPLGGNRRGTVLTYRNLMLTMVLGGLWHGAAWTFVIWGFIHGAALAMERLVGADPSTGRWQVVIRWFVTFHIVCVAWVLFRAETFELATDFLSAMVTAPMGTGVEWFAVVLIVAALAAQIIPSDALADLRLRAADTDPLLQGAVLGIWIALVVALGPEGVAPFIYFQF